MAIKPSILANSYVKFVRANSTLWNSLLNKDKDTLYFIVDDGQTKGSLYLGDALIATSLDEGLSVEDLKNVVVNGQLEANHVLVANGEGQWLNQSIYDFMPVTMVGATETDDGAGGLVPVPTAGQQGLFLRGDGSWVSPTTALESTVGNLSTKVNGLEEVLNNVIGEDVNKTIRDVALDVTNKAVTDLVNNAPEAFDTLKEIADWITGDHEGSVDAADLITDVAQLKETVYTETTGLVGRVGVLETNVSDLTEAFNILADVVGGETHGLVKDVADNTAAIEANATEISEIWDMLKWNELVDDSTTTT